MSYTAAGLEEARPDDVCQSSPGFGQKPLFPLSQTKGQL